MPTNGQQDEYTLKKLTEIYMKNRNPEALLMQTRAGTGELRVLIRHAREPGVARVRFLPPANTKGDFTPDIEVTWKNGKTTFVEVRTMTQASPWLSCSHSHAADVLVFQICVDVSLSRQNASCR
jgi:hypothetical protein